MRLKPKTILLTSVVDNQMCTVVLTKEDYEQFNIKTEQQLISFLDSIYKPNFNWEFEN